MQYCCFLGVENFAILLIMLQCILYSTRTQLCSTFKTKHTHKLRKYMHCWYLVLRIWFNNNTRVKLAKQNFVVFELIWCSNVGNMIIIILEKHILDCVHCTVMHVIRELPFSVILYEWILKYLCLWLNYKNSLNWNLYFKFGLYFGLRVRKSYKYLNILFISAILKVITFRFTSHK